MPRTSLYSNLPDPGEWHLPTRLHHMRDNETPLSEFLSKPFRCSMCKEPKKADELRIGNTQRFEVICINTLTCTRKQAQDRSLVQKPTVIPVKTETVPDEVPVVRKKRRYKETPGA